LDGGQKLPFAVDTGASGTLLDKSLEPKLGKPMGTAIRNAWGVLSTNNFYAAPRLSLKGVPLQMTGPAVTAWVLKQFSTPDGRPVMGILGMDVLEHYCIQLDFAAARMRFLDSQRADRSTWGKAFPIVALNDHDARPAVAGNLFGTPDSLSLVDSGYNSDGWLRPVYFRQWTNEARVRTNGEARWPHGQFGGEQYPLVALSEEDVESDAIGMCFLARHQVTLDFPHHMLYLRRQSIGPLLDPKLEKAKPIRDKEPQVTAHLRAMIKDWMEGAPRVEDYTEEAWERVSLKQGEIRGYLKRLGPLDSMTLLDRRRAGGQRIYSYRMQFAHATVLARFTLTEENKATHGEMTTVEWREPPSLQIPR